MGHEYAECPVCAAMRRGADGPTYPVPDWDTWTITSVEAGPSGTINRWEPRIPSIDEWPDA